PLTGSAIVYFRRLGHLNKRPVLLEDVYLNADVFPGVEQAPLQEMPLSEVVRQRYQLEPTDGEQSYHVTRGPDCVAQALSLPSDQHLLLMQLTLNFPNPSAAPLSRQYCRTDHIPFAQRLGAPAHDRFHPRQSRLLYGVRRSLDSGRAPRHVLRAQCSHRS